MAVAFRAKSNNGGASGTDLTVNKPTGTLDNDILIADTYSEASGTAFTLPAGWTWVAAAVQNSNSNFWHRVAWKRASSEGSSWTFTHSSSAWRTVVCSAWSGGVTSGDPQDATADSDNAASTTVTAGTITTSTNNSMNIAGVMSYNLDDLGASSSGYTDGGIFDSHNLFYAIQASSGASGTKTFTSASASGNWTSWHISIKEAASATQEQEGFRFGEDDGSESAHTWTANQDTNISTADNTAKLLRVLVNATLDPASAAYTLRYQKNGAGGYTAVPLGSGTSPTLSWGAAGTIAYSASGGTSVAPTYPTGITTNSALVLVVGQKPSSANGGTVTTPSGWTLQGSLTGSNDGDTGGYTTTLGADTGNTNIYVYTKDTVSGSESGTLSVTVGTNNVCWANIYRVEASDTGTWSFAIGTGKDTSAGNVSIATGSMDIASGDFILAGMVIPTDVTTPSQFSAEALSQSGTTFGTVTEIEEPDSTTGNDIGGFIVRAPVSSGSGSGAVTLSATAGGTTTNVRGPGFVLRLRITGITNDVYVNTSSNITAGGEATTARLTAPSGKTTGDFVTGRRWDDENGTDSTDITTDDYSEFEWSLKLKSGLTNGDYFEFRVYAGSTALDTYTVTPKWTVTTTTTHNASATMAGTSSLTGVGKLAIPFSATMAGTSSLTGVGRLAIPFSATMAGTSSLTASGLVAVMFSATMAGTSSLTGVGKLNIPVSATMAGTSSLTGVGKLAIPFSATMAGTSSLTASGLVAVLFSATVTGTSSLTGVGKLTLPFSATAAGTSTLTGVGRLVLPFSATMAGTSSLTASGLVGVLFSATVTGTSSLTGVGKLTLPFSATAAGTSSLTGVGKLAIPFSATMAGTSSLTASGITLLLFSSTMAGTSSLTGAGRLIIPVTVMIEGTSSLNVDGDLLGARFTKSRFFIKYVQPHNRPQRR